MCSTQHQHLKQQHVGRHQAYKQAQAYEGVGAATCILVLLHPRTTSSTGRWMNHSEKKKASTAAEAQPMMTGLFSAFSNCNSAQDQVAQWQRQARHVSSSVQSL